MAIITIQKIVPGMVLAEDAVHHNGRVLLKAGSELNDKHIKIFKSWGLSTLNVKTDEAEETGGPKRHTADQIKRVIAKQKRAFKYCDLNHPFTHQLFRASVDMKLK